MSLRRSPLYDVHDENGASFTEFGGWEMPVDFDSIRAEHEVVREAVGIFDVSHMGEVLVGGPDATALTQRLTTRDVTRLSPGQSHYAMITDQSGIILDDTVVYRLPEDWDPTYLVVPNAGHDAEMTDWWTDHAAEWNLDASVANATEEYGLFAVQGPDAVEVVSDVATQDLADVSRFDVVEIEIASVDVLASRTGYTGEDGFELFVPAAESERVWRAIDCPPCGLGARDTLRTEMGYLLSGQDFDPEDNPRTPYEARVGFTVDLEPDFLGRNALAEVVEDGPAEVFTGVRLEERGVPRHGYPILADGEVVGEITSGTMSPTLGDPIGLGYLPVELANDGTTVAVEIRGEAKMGKVVTPPFLRSSR